ncbi:polymeric immunoglobulin receptor-like isoform X2 [Acanthochromis polyacanthus]|uniref:polymeric immunoglobulin receptor-like isoform X2 n=1 Tax=Acanthochromis polyacanthus TaxID=80966 RepID=UPI0022346B0D|nr:polymeric immunoglobulin receptor-like isoform X2 [Acanthochromis polyacanthus]
MKSLCSVLLTFCTALSSLSGAAGFHVFGYEGRDVNVSCHYDEGYQGYEKYLCRNGCGDSDVLIMTGQTKKGRYSIYDDKKARKSTVTISDLRASDSGTYWCGVTRTGKDLYNEVKLEIRQDSCCDHVTEKESHDGGSVSFSCPYESENQNNLKYFCRGTQPSTCLQQALVTSDNEHNGQFTLTDDKEIRKFTVNISSLTQKDSGSYLCGVHRNNGFNVFAAIKLEVKEWCCVKSHNMSGIVGHAVTLQCPYLPKHKNNRKFLCKGDHHKNCRDVITSKSRFSMQDDVSSSLFSVTISGLEAGDAGTYWCVSDSQWGIGNYTKIQLSVDVVLYVVVTVSAVSLIVIFALVIACKYKRHKVQGAEVNTYRSKPNTSEEAMGGVDIYENQEVVQYAKPMKSGQQNACSQYDNEGEDQPDYENITEDIYCNQSFHQGYNR